MMDLAELNAMPAERFVEALGGIYEHSPWVAEAVLSQRPFATLDDLARAMAAAVAAAGDDAQLRLIRAHPELGARLRIAELTDASRAEQQGAGLDQCTAAEFAALQQLNAAYGERFGFPFILAVKGHSRDSIIAAMRARLDNDADAERREALKQIDLIARYRLEQQFQ